MTLDVLIIDDKEQKIDNLRKVITSISDEINVEEAQTIVDARDKMRDVAYDLVILDMVIPELEGDEPSRTGGADFLTEIYENDDIKRPLQVIGLTEYEEEFSQQKEEFRDRLWYLLFYSQRDMKWRKALKDKVIQLAGMKRDFVRALTERNKYDVGIICALSEEFEQMQKAFDGCEWEDCRLEGLPWLFRTTTVATSSLKDLRVIAACAEHPGVCATSVMATALYTVAHVDAIFMTGFAAGIKNEDIRLDDVIIAESVSDYATGKLAETEMGELNWLKEIHQVNANSQLLSVASSLTRDEGVKNDINVELRNKNLKTERDNVQFSAAKTVCGPFVIASEQIVEALKADDRKFQAIDMEGFGLYLTADTLERKALWIKAISDFGDNGKDNSRHKCCAYVSAAFLYQLLREKF